jgi:glycosyltransferase involved in cell wall biosynthesis
MLGSKLDRVMSNASAVTAGSGVLAKYAREFNKQTIVLPSVVDSQLLFPKIGVKDSHFFTVGWIGSPSTSKYLDLLVYPLQALATQFRVRFLAVGGIAPSMLGVEVVNVSWALEDEVTIINKFDVGVMPLTDDEWSRGKCGYKIIQYMSCGVPVVASKVGANIEIISKDTGYLASTEAEWISALTILASSPHIRTVIGANARRKAVTSYSLKSNLPILAHTIRGVLRG